MNGQFDQLLLPGGFQWQVLYNTTSVTLKVLAAGGLPGDFDNNGVVNNADLIPWRAGLGTTYTGGDFLVWQRNLGAGGGVSAVPEPGALVLGLVALAFAAMRRRTRC